MRFIAIGCLAVSLASTWAWADLGSGLRAMDLSDYATARKELTPIAEGGDVTAQFNLGNIYLYGWGVKKNVVEAAKWFRKAAEHGDWKSQKKLAYMYEQGVGVDKNLAEAEKWSRISKERESASAQASSSATQRNPGGSVSLPNIDREGRSPAQAGSNEELLAAVASDNVKEVKRLLSAGAGVNARTRSGGMPLIIAAANGNQQMVKVLLNHGADVNAKDGKGFSALLQTFESLTLVYYLTSTSQGAVLYRQKFMSAEDVKRMQMELSQAKDQPKAKWREVAFVLIEHGANVNVDWKSDTPLGLAALFGDKGLAEALINKGAEVNGSKDAGETPLHSAIAEQHRDVAELLINNGANVNALNISGRTPLHFFASLMDDRELTELTIAKGAHVNARDKSGITPLTYATRKGNGAVAEVLRRHGGTE